jgi:hypothetical protein
LVVARATILLEESLRVKSGTRRVAASRFRLVRTKENHERAIAIRRECAGESRSQWWLGLRALAVMMALVVSIPAGCGSRLA